MKSIFLLVTLAFVVNAMGFEEDDESNNAANKLVPIKEYCQRRGNGLYKDPYDCRAFVMCIMHRPHQLICPAAHYWNPNTKLCDPNQELKKNCRWKNRPAASHSLRRKPITCKFRGLPCCVKAGVWAPSGYMYFFKGQKYWKFNIAKSAVVRGYPKKIVKYWPKMPANPDATLYIPYHGLYFIKGAKLWKYQDLKILGQRITTIFKGLQPNIDAAFYWAYNRKIYFMKARKYWRYTRKGRKFTLDRGYPKDIRFGWKGVPINVDAITTMPHGKTFWFKGKYFYEYESPKCMIHNPQVASYDEERSAEVNSTEVPSAASPQPSEVEDLEIFDGQAEEIPISFEQEASQHSQQSQHPRNPQQQKEREQPKEGQQRQPGKEASSQHSQQSQHLRNPQQQKEREQPKERQQHQPGKEASSQHSQQSQHPRNPQQQKEGEQPAEGQQSQPVKETSSTFLDWFV